MTTFQAIKSDLYHYTITVESLFPIYMNDEYIESAIVQLRSYQQALSSLDRHPLKVERITLEDRRVIIEQLDRIGNVFLDQIGFCNQSITICRFSSEVEKILDHLIAYSEISSLRTLSSIGEKLTKSAANASLKISRQVQTYREGPLTADSAKQTLDVISKQLKYFTKLLKLATSNIKKLLKTTQNCINQCEFLPEDFVNQIRESIHHLYHVFGKISDSLIFEAEEFHPVLNRINFITEMHHTVPLDPSYCDYSNQILSYFQQIHILSQQIITKMEELNPCWIILLHNIYRLQGMIVEASQMINQLPAKVEKALKVAELNSAHFARFNKKTDNADFTPDIPFYVNKRKEEINKKKQRLIYTQNHFEELKRHPIILNAQERILQIQNHPKAAHFFQGNSFNTPLYFESGFWLLQSLRINSMQDVETVYIALNKYSHAFFSLLSLFRGKSKTEWLNPWIFLGELEEILENYSPLISPT